MSLLDDAIAALTAKVNDAVTVEESAIAFINGVPGLIANAVAEATAAGATPEQLAAVTALGDRLTAEAANLTAAVTANTPPVDNPNP